MYVQVQSIYTLLFVLLDSIQVSTTLMSIWVKAEMKSDVCVVCKMRSIKTCMHEWNVKIKDKQESEWYNICIYGRKLEH